jgi:hypothetical protein
VKCSATTLAIVAVLSASLALAEDFKTIKGKVYKDATITRVDADGIVLRTKTGISKVYFIELPKDVQERFHPRPSPTRTVAAQREPEPIKKTGWAAAVANPIAFIVLVFAGLLLSPAWCLLSSVVVFDQATMRTKSKIKYWEIIIDNLRNAGIAAVSRVRITRGDNSGLCPQSAATLDALLCIQIKSYLPFSNSNPQFKPTDIIMSGDCPEPDEELGNHR